LIRKQNDNHRYYGSLFHEIIFLSRFPTRFPFSPELSHDGLLLGCERGFPYLCTRQIFSDMEREKKETMKGTKRSGGRKEADMVDT